MSVRSKRTLRFFSSTATSSRRINRRHHGNRSRLDALDLATPVRRSAPTSAPTQTTIAIVNLNLFLRNRAAQEEGTARVWQCVARLFIQLLGLFRHRICSSLPQRTQLLDAPASARQPPFPIAPDPLFDRPDLVTTSPRLASPRLLHNPPFSLPHPPLSAPSSPSLKLSLPARSSSSPTNLSPLRPAISPRIAIPPNAYLYLHLSPAHHWILDSDVSRWTATLPHLTCLFGADCPSPSGRRRPFSFPLVGQVHLYFRSVSIPPPRLDPGNYASVSSPQVRLRARFEDDMINSINIRDSLAG
ncbi:hypothetical protein C8R45DRAFT_1222040 [Mycena sanguinolenta]|nr:hypothetical protein C8R45DRAFT_1222040 [Mycena sanguinolenta]